MKPKINRKNRLKAVKKLLSGSSYHQVCQEFSISKSLLSRFKSEYLASGRNPFSLHVGRPVNRKMAQSKLTPEERYKLFNLVLDEKLNVSKACKKFGISRTIFYRLKKRVFEESGKQAVGYKSEQDKLKPFQDRSTMPHNQWKRTPKQIEDLVLEVAIAQPNLSVHKMTAYLNKEVKPGLISNKGVQNIFKRNHLSTLEQRIQYSRLMEEAYLPKLSLRDLPQIPLKLWRQLYAPFATIPKLGFLISRGWTSLGILLVLTYLFVNWLAVVVEAKEGQRLGLVFASSALFFGIVFFLYSLKYYLSLIIALRANTSPPLKEGTTNNQTSQTADAGFFDLVLAPFNAFKKVFPRSKRLINVDEQNIDLTDHPFVSIQIPFYNEKRVV
ncbi:MAG TPA: hypothetical protein VIK81_00905, partial [Patescibacteria group bacterium]